MGEYARIKKNKEEIKIGTCELMYYLRYEDANLVDYFDNAASGLYDDNKTKEFSFRIPFIDELKTPLGEYGVKTGFNRGHPLRNFPVDKTMMNYTGIIQLYHKNAGILVNLPCTHGGDLPKIEGGSASYNGRAAHYIELIHIKHHSDGLLYPIIGCKLCNNQWRCDWDEVLPFIDDKPLSERLQCYIERNLTA